MERLARRLLWLAAALLAGACAGLPPPERPRLVVFLAVDGLPQWQVTEYRDQLAPDGLRRFLDRGAWFADAHHGHAFTVTAPGHAVMLTGAYPHRTGIVGNEWIDPASGAPVYCASDPDHVYLENDTPRLAGTSPRNLLAETLGDVLRRHDARSKVIAISGKDRGAIFPAGKNGVAYMYMGDSGRFASSTYYMKEHPAWVKAFNDARPADRYFKASWSPLLPEAAYAKSLPDERPWYGTGGKLPKTFGEGSDGPGPGFYSSLLAGPFADELTLAFARAALAGEGLGQDDAPDILAVSLSGHDYVNHAWGAESRLSHDHLLRVDRMLQDFFAELDRRVGRERYVAVLTADHGFTPAPEYSRSIGRDAGRTNRPQMLARLNAGLSEKFGAGNWVRAWSANGALFDASLIEQRRVDRRALEQEARRRLLEDPGVVAVFGRTELAQGKYPAGTPFLDQVRKGTDPERSPDLQVVVRPFWVLQALGARTTTHGSPHPYDTHVPILFWGPSWLGAGRVDARVEVADIAPTLARLLGVPAPAQSEGRPLPLPRREGRASGRPPTPMNRFSL
jgi:predicted AlkP superfamily pyrophosphatase or phosphodiesterase